jgi:hypothetical protein
MTWRRATILPLEQTLLKSRLLALEVAQKFVFEPSLGKLRFFEGR